MRRLLPSAFFLLTLALLAACGPRTADRGPSLPPSTVNGPSSTVSPTTPTVDRGLWTVTPTAYPLSSIISADLQHILESRQGWTFRWDAGRAAYLITQRAWDADKAQFKSSTLGEIGYLDTEGILHLHSTSFTAKPGEKSAFVTDQSHNDLTLDLKQFSPPTPEATATQTATPENNALEIQLGPFTFIETKNPLYEKTGILKFTDENGVTYVYSPASALTSEQTINGKKVKVAEFASLEKNDQGVMALSLDALHSGFPVAWLIANGYDRPFPQDLVDWFKIPGDYTKSVGYTIHFEYKDNGTPNDLTDDTKFAMLSPPYHKNPKNFKLPVLDEDGKFLWFFVTDEKTGESFFTVPIQLLNPLDPNNPHPDETMFVFVTPGTMTPEQLKLFKEKYIDTGIFQSDILEKSLAQIILAQEGGYFEKNAEAWNAYLNRGPLDSLLAGEGNDLNGIYWGNTYDFGAVIKDEFDNYMPTNNLTVDEILIKANGKYVDLPKELQLKIFGLGF